MPVVLIGPSAKADAMWLFVGEAMGALSLLLFIVWWTLGPTQRREREEMRELADQEAARVGEAAPAAPSRDD